MGLRTAPLPSLNTAVNRLLDRLYWSVRVPQKPTAEKHIPKYEGNGLICACYPEGETSESIGANIGLSGRMVHQLIYC